MILDNLTDIEQSVKPKRTIFQKIAMIIEIGLCVFLGIGIFFKLESFPYASEFLILSMTSLAGLFSIMNFFFTPFLGSYSDRIGRRPIILLSW